MTQLFGRTWKARIGTIEVSDLDVEFSIFKSVKREPNKCTLTVYGLSEDTRQSIEQQGRTSIEVRAGYGEDPQVLFVGEITATGTTTVADGVDVTMTIEAKDSGIAYQRARINQSFAAGTQVEDVLRAVVRALGIGDGNLSDFIANYTLLNGVSTFSEGFVASGPARDVLDSIVRGAGLRWAVQNGVLSIRQRGSSLQTQAVLLSANTGLLGSPTADPNGIITAVCLIQAGLDPGRKVSLKSRQFDGGYSIRAVKYDGSTTGDAWNATLTLMGVDALQSQQTRAADRRRQAANAANPSGTPGPTP